uniref:Metalloendopeptidase n=1 Tax=Macrostomum lignano TaxID=282301 RepID=A0A1I8JNZ9_9PLAT
MQAQASAIATTATDPTMATSRQAEDNIKIIEGDIMISQTHQSQMLNGQAAAASAASIYWPNGTVYYSLSVDYTASEADYIESSLQELQLYVGSAVQFKRVSPGEAADYIEVYSGSGCSSFVGRQTGPQWLSLQRGVCLQKYIIQHEFMHALGFWHEQSRADRDHSVVIWWSNIDSG